jgi:hypothetical protein
MRGVMRIKIWLSDWRCHPGIRGKFRGWIGKMLKKQTFEPSAKIRKILLKYSQRLERIQEDPTNTPLL